MLGCHSIAGPATLVYRRGRAGVVVEQEIKVLSIDADQARAAGELLGRAGLSGHRCALDSLVAVVALSQPRPVVVLTSDADDMTKLVEEPGRPAKERVAVVRI